MFLAQKKSDKFIRSNKYKELMKLTSLYTNFCQTTLITMMMHILIMLMMSQRYTRCYSQHHLIIYHSTSTSGPVQKRRKLKEIEFEPIQQANRRSKLFAFVGVSLLRNQVFVNMIFYRHLSANNCVINSSRWAYKYTSKLHRKKLTQ